MRIPSGTVDQYVYFVGVDATDFSTRETGLTTFTIYRSRNGGAAAAMTTPTINETSSANMPGVYELLLDEDMTIDSGDDSQEMVFHITHAGMAPVTRTIELYRPKITLGETSTAQTGDSFARLGAPAGASVSADIAAIEAQTDDIGAAGAGLTAVPWNAAWDAEVESEVTDALNTYDPPTKAELDSAVAPLATATNLATVAGYLDTEIAAILEDTGTTLPALLAALDSLIDAVKVVTDALPNSGALTDLATAAALATVAGYIDTEVAAIKAKTDNLPAAPAAVGDIPTALQNADALLDRDMAAVVETNPRSPLNALRFLRNKYSISGTTLTVTKENDTTTAWTAVVTKDPAGVPITGSDPA